MEELTAKECLELMDILCAMMADKICSDMQKRMEEA